MGRRIGFYKIRGEIGCGNFSHVKLGIHALTKGTKPQDMSETQKTWVEMYYSYFRDNIDRQIEQPSLKKVTPISCSLLWLLIRSK